MFHPEGISLLCSISKILKMLQFPVSFKNQIFRHPNVPFSKHVKISGSFRTAIRAKKVLATFTEKQDHAVALFDIVGAELICKNSYHSDTVHKIPLALNTPSIGYFIKFSS